MKTDPKNPAFGLNALLPGLTKREYFAAIAMQGLCTNASMDKPFNTKMAGKNAVVLADALIKALNAVVESKESE